jgi:flagellar hook-associated protein 1 FlgK
MTVPSINIAMSGIAAAQAGLSTVSHNISNVNTPGFTRQEAVQSASTPKFEGGGYLGTGVDVSSVRRAYAEQITLQSQAAASQAAQFATQRDALNRLNTLVGNGDAGANGAITDFFTSAEQLSNNPSDLASRQSVLASAQTVVQRFGDLAAALHGERAQADTQIKASITTINSLASQIAKLNVSVSSELGAGRQPNDLLDRRDVLMGALNKQVRAQYVVQSSGVMNVYLTNGQALVVGNSAQAMGMAADELDPSVMRVGMQAGSTITPFASQMAVGGELGGSLAYRDQNLAEAGAYIGRLAAALCGAVNARSALGQDLAGRPGSDLFSVAQPMVTASTANTGAGTVSAAVADAAALAASDYRVRYDGTNYEITRTSDGKRQSFSSLPQQIDGLNIAMDGSPAAGDVFLVSATRGAAGSMKVAMTVGSALAAALPVRASTTPANGGDLAIEDMTVTARPATNAKLTITFNGAGGYSVTGGASTVTGSYANGDTIALDGWSLKLRGMPKAGDTVVVEPNAGGTGDNRNALAMASLADADLVQGMSFAGSWGQMLANLGVQGRELETTATAAQALSTQLDAVREGVAGVNLDEEAMNLVKFQQAYQAASKVVSIANSLFDDILQVLR